nr:hypothetical protein [uncultured Undibacterium sp.]
MSLLANLSLQAQAQTKTAIHHSYVMKLDRWGNAIYQSLELDEQDDRISGSIDRDPFVGVRRGGTYTFTATAADKTTYNYVAKITSEGLNGTADFPDSNRPQIRVQHAFSALEFLLASATFRRHSATFPPHTPTHFHLIAYRC